ncbi:cytochrome P450 4c3-like [Aricia agestis]|uniref:cytochrome P450 4c3-like n=1 Tax=Aricia agestis TaxID=91739 RepID=UPI001C209C34|nr:cytochrome P450 4c3-like [Aricia agestis]
MIVSSFTLTHISTAVLVGLFFYWLHKQLLKKCAIKSSSDAKLRSIPLIDNVKLVFANNDETFKNMNDLTEKYGHYLKFWFGLDLNICIKNPTDIRFLLTSNKINEKGPFYRYIATYVGEGILSGGPLWRAHRKIVTPAYNKKSVQTYSFVFNKEGEELANSLLQKDPNVTFDVFSDVVIATTQSVCQTLMGLPKEDSLNLKYLTEIMTETERLYHQTCRQITEWWLQIPFCYWIFGKKVEKNYLNMVRVMILDVLERKKRLKSESTENEIMNAVDKWLTIREMDDNLILETFSIFTTSQEASAKITSTVLLALAHLPEWQEKVVNEIYDVLESNDQVITEEQIKKLHFLDMVFKEAVRYLPIAPVIQRRVSEEVTIDDGKITLPVGTSVVIPIHSIHRDPEFWEEPNKFDPGRFMPENISKRNPEAYLPFSLGPMDCLGRIYATALVKTLVVKVLLKVKLEADGRLEDLKLRYAISVHFEDGYRLRVCPRQNEFIRNII